MMNYKYELVSQEEKEIECDIELKSLEEIKQLNEIKTPVLDSYLQKFDINKNIEKYCEELNQYGKFFKDMRFFTYLPKCGYFENYNLPENEDCEIEIEFDNYTERENSIKVYSLLSLLTVESYTKTNYLELYEVFLLGDRFIKTYEYKNYLTNKIKIKRLKENDELYEVLNSENGLYINNSITRVKNPSNLFCKIAVYNNFGNLKFIKNSSKEVQEIVAMKSNFSKFLFIYCKNVDIEIQELFLEKDYFSNILNPCETIIWKALKKNIENIRFVKKPTLDMYKFVIINDKENLIIDKNLPEEIMLIISNKNKNKTKKNNCLIQ